jgi:hypothetical protein
MKIAFIGFGEAGRAFCDSLAAAERNLAFTSRRRSRSRRSGGQTNPWHGSARKRSRGGIPHYSCVTTPGRDFERMDSR